MEDVVVDIAKRVVTASATRAGAWQGKKYSNLDITNKSIRPFLFTISNNAIHISNVICLVNPQNGSWLLFTISLNSLY